MKKVLIIVSYFCAAVLQIYAQNDIVLKIDDMVNQYYNMNLFSGTIMVAEKGKPIYQKAIGYADIENKISNEINTVNFG